MIIDQAQRSQALDPCTSFIVQAPAGSGKTEILTQRYLRLLATVSEPEQIIAITFTRKAASEMRERIIESLRLGQGPEPELAHKQTTWSLAKQGLMNDAKHRWELLNNPNRLRILTIDALAGFLTGQMPLLASLGAKPSIAADASSLYVLAIERSLQRLSQDEPWVQDLQTILLHIDNRMSLLQDLLFALLAKREQWLPLIVELRQDPDRFRPVLENALQSVGKQALASLQTALAQANPAELFEYLLFASRMLDHNWFADASDFSDITDISVWQNISMLLLTKDGSFRKSLTKNQGFPAPSSATDPAEKKYRQQMKAGITEWLNENTENTELLQALQFMQLAPPASYTEQQWRVLGALIQLLPLVIAELQLIFHERGEVDFIELNLAALRALGHDNDVTDLALYLDYKIQHLLIDEFQDTSQLQFQLLEKIISEWQSGDGRTLFCVGDPMQSIYRFRNAEVSLFLKVQQQGIAQLKPVSLQLEQNFRTQGKLVEWFNHTFAQVFPVQSDMAVGAIEYTSATAFQAPADKACCCYEVETEQTPEQVVAIIQAARAEQNDCSIAILVKSRTHLAGIVPALQQANIAYQAIDIDSLADLSVIQDLSALTRAYLHLADKVAWFASLRAPWAGLSLADLHTLAMATPGRLLWPSLQRFEQLALSDNGKRVLRQVVPLLEQALANKGRLSLGAAIQGLWQALGGADTLTDDSEDIAVSQFFQCLQTLEQQAKPISAERIDAELQKLFATQAVSDSNPVEIMTIHKSKGLEFDHVIMPGLERGAQSDRAELFSWYEKPNLESSSDLILAPIKASSDNAEPINDYIRAINKQRSDYEAARVFYVGCTRAKQVLHLVATVPSQDRKDFSPNRSSFLNMLWAHSWWPQQRLDTTTASQTVVQQAYLYRLPESYQRPVVTHPVRYSSSPIPIQTSHDWQRVVGTVIHHVLEHLNQQTLQAKTHLSAAQLKSLLHYQQLPTGYMPQAMAKIDRFYQRLFNDPKAEWLFSDSHQHIKTEYALSTTVNGKVEHYVIDRTFIDNDDVRWIIDFKTSEPSGQQSLQAFMQAESFLYQQQLQQYAKLFTHEGRGVRCLLYWCVLGEWQEVATKPETAGAEYAQ